MDFVWSEVTSVENEFESIQSSSCVPNPFINSTSIKYTLDKPGLVKIFIFDNVGKLIKNIEKLQPKGDSQTMFNAENLSPGMYHYKIHVGGIIHTGNIVLIR